MKIDKNIIIKYNNPNEAKDCFNKLEQLGFNNYKEHIPDVGLIFFGGATDKFIPLIGDYLCVSKKDNIITYKYFIKLYNKQIKENKPDLVFDKNGKILKVNNIDKDYKMFVHSTYGNWIDEYIFSGECIATNLLEVDYYVVKEDLEKALKRKETENKLRLLAFELNGNRDITEEEWKDYKIEKYYLYYIMSDNSINSTFNLESKNQGTIFCLSRCFKDRAIELIGEEDLKDYLINC